MCWLDRKSIRSLAVIGAVALGGCAKPRGVLFPMIDPPMVWPASPNTPRIELIGMISDSRDLAAEQTGVEVFRAALRGPRPPIMFTSPHGVAVSDRERLAVADGNGAAVHIIDLHERTHTMISGFGDERFGAPVGVTWADDLLYVSDAERGEIVVLDAAGAFLSRFGSDVLRRPVGIAYARARDALYVADGDAHCVRVFDRDGNLRNTIGNRGEAPGEFNYPSHIACSGDRLLVTDSGNFRVQLMDLDGNVRSVIGKKGNAAGDFALPKGVAIDSEGHVYVVDARFENVQMFDGRGQLLMALGGEGREPGRFWLPAGIMIDDQDRIWVADGGNRRIQVFQYLRAAS